MMRYWVFITTLPPRQFGEGGAHYITYDLPGPASAGLSIPDVTYLLSLIFILSEIWRFHAAKAACRGWL